MKILLYARFFPDSFGRNIAAAAEHMGHTVRAVEESFEQRSFNRYWRTFWVLLPKVFPASQAWRHRALVEAARTFSPDLILLTSAEVPLGVVRELRLVCAAKVAVWYPDALVNLGRQYLLASDLDAWFFKDPYMARAFRHKLEINAHYLPEACNPLWHHRVELTEADRRKYACELCTVSNMYYYRARMLEMFKDYDLKIWGISYPSWLESPLRPCYPNVYVAELEKAKAFAAAKIVLNTMHYAEIEGVNCRLFEAAGCGAFQIADWKPALAELFEPEREMVTFRTREELKEKVDYYLAHPEERQEIAERAYVRAQRDHTYEVRLRAMFQILSLSSRPEVEVHAEVGQGR